MITKVIQTIICVFGLTMGLDALIWHGGTGFIGLFNSMFNGNIWAIVYFFLVILIMITPIWMCYKGTGLIFNASRSDKFWMKISLWVLRIVLFIFMFYYFYFGILISLIGIWIVK